MMTIKDFASLCGCNTQTLRYYDKIELLRPVQVDQQTGYRYYEKCQAVEFVKIKNLQTADFTIDEIKMLLTLPDDQIYEAFYQKIAEQEQKLERIKKIQQSYLTEKTNMERLIQNTSGYILQGVSDYTILQEFGLSADEGENVKAMIQAYIEGSISEQLTNEEDIRLVIDDQMIRGAEQAADAIAELDNYEHTMILDGGATPEDVSFTLENSECLWQCHGWQFVREFIDNIPSMDELGDYGFIFRLTDDKPVDGLEFPLFMIAAMLPKAGPNATITGCCIEHSEDGQNHFWLRKKK